DGRGDRSPRGPVHSVDQGHVDRIVKTIAVVDYGMGNLRSVAKALEHVSPGSRVVVTGDAAVVRAADRVVFPGQGAMPDCMRNLAAHGLDEAVRRAAETRPFLG